MSREDLYHFKGNCLFCRIAAGEIPCEKVYEDSSVLAFRDINPQARVHIVVIPKEHYADSVMDISVLNTHCFGYIFEAIAKIARQEGLEEDGFRVVTNCGENAGQTVKHLHFHILGGEKLSERLA